MRFAKALHIPWPTELSLLYYRATMNANSAITLRRYYFNASTSIDGWEEGVQIKKPPDEQREKKPHLVTISTSANADIRKDLSNAQPSTRSRPRYALLC